MDFASSAVIEFKRASYSVNGHTLLHETSYEIKQGELLVLLGRSGAGKSTSLKLINGLLSPSTGSVVVEGKSTGDWNPIRLKRRIGYVIQEVGLFPHYTVGRNVALTPTLENWPQDRIDLRVREMLELVGLEPNQFKHRFPRELSGGQRQRVGVARALAADPPILLLDEPFGALDPLTRSQIRREFRDLHRRLGKTIVFVTHDVREAFFLATRIGLMKDGRVTAIVKPEEFSKLQDREAQAFAECLK